MLYLYLRTRRALAYSKDAISALAKVAARFNPEFFAAGDRAWEDGYVMRIDTSRTPGQVAPILKRALKRPNAQLRSADEDAELFDAWACHDAKGAVREHPGAARLSAFGARHGSGFCQILIRYDVNDRVQQSAIDHARARLSDHGECAAAFNFRDGVILCISSGDPGKITFRRCQDLMRKIPMFYFIAADGECFDPGGGGCWINGFVDSNLWRSSA